MKSSQIIAKTIETGFCDKPGFIGLAASSENESAEIFFQATQAPAIAAVILLSSQNAVKKMDQQSVIEGMANNLEISRRTMPDAIDVTLVSDGDVLCINVGSGALFLKLTDTAKKKLKYLGTLQS